MNNIDNLTLQWFTDISNILNDNCQQSTNEFGEPEFECIACKGTYRKTDKLSDLLWHITEHINATERS